MTREEAESCIGTIELLRRLAYNIHGVMDVIDADNCEKIIKALSQEPTVTSTDETMTMVYPTIVCDDAISRQAMLDYLKANVDDFPDYHEAIEKVLQMPPVKPQEPCDECRNKRTSFCGNCKEYDEFEPCDDVVSRKAVRQGMMKYGFTAPDMTVHEFIEDELPSVTQKSGKWIPVYQGDEIINYRCSECEFGNTFGKSTYRMNFCPNCGADMRGAE